MRIPEVVRRQKVDIPLRIEPVLETLDHRGAAAQAIDTLLLVRLLRLQVLDRPEHDRWQIRYLGHVQRLLQRHAENIARHGGDGALVRRSPKVPE